MQDTGTERQAEDEGRRGPNRRERRRAKQVLAWLLKTQAEETPEQRIQREKEEREDFIADFWNGIPASERLRLCMVGGAFGPRESKPTIEPMPLEVIKARIPRIYEQ